MVKFDSFQRIAFIGVASSVLYQTQARTSYDVKNVQKTRPWGLEVILRRIDERLHVQTRTVHVTVSSVASNRLRLTNFFLRSSRNKVDLLSFESKTTDKREQYDWMGEKIWTGIFMFLTKMAATSRQTTWPTSF